MKVKTLKNGQAICSVIDFPLEKFAALPVLERKITRTKKTKLLDIVTAFDIETTRIKSIEQAVMYIWQWHFAEPINLTVVGRTWEEFEAFTASLEAYMRALSQEDYHCSYVSMFIIYHTSFNFCVEFTILQMMRFLPLTAAKS